MALLCACSASHSLGVGIYLMSEGGQSEAWTDSIVPPPTTEAKRVQELEELITLLMQARPEVARLPAPAVGCD